MSPMDYGDTSKGGDMKPWKPGVQGKGLVIDGKVITWEDSGVGLHHPEVAQDQFDNLPKVHREYAAFYITPRGDVTFSIMTGPEKIAEVKPLIEQSNPDLKVSPSQTDWEFAKDDWSDKLDGAAGSPTKFPNEQQNYHTEDHLPHLAAPQLEIPDDENDPESLQEHLDRGWRADQGNFGKGFIDDKDQLHHWPTAQAHDLEAGDGWPSHHSMEEHTGTYGEKPFAIEPDGHIHTYNNYDRTDEQQKALEQRILKTIPGTRTYDDWHFSKRHNSNEFDEPGDDAPEVKEALASGWQMGNEGKGLVKADGEVIHWPVGAKGSSGQRHNRWDGYPFHRHVVDELGLKGDDLRKPFWIDPEGGLRVYKDDPETEAQVRDAIKLPDSRHEKWNFVERKWSNAGMAGSFAPMLKLWTQQVPQPNHAQFPGASQMLTDLQGSVRQAHGVDSWRVASESEIPSVEWLGEKGNQGDHSFWYRPDEKRVIIGSPEKHHDEIAKASGATDYNYDTGGYGPGEWVAGSIQGNGFELYDDPDKVHRPAVAEALKAEGVNEQDKVNWEFGYPPKSNIL